MKCQMSWNVKCHEMSNVMKCLMSWNTETPGLTHFGAYHLHSDGHFIPDLVSISPSRHPHFDIRCQDSALPQIWLWDEQSCNLVKKLAFLLASGSELPFCPCLPLIACWKVLTNSIGCFLLWDYHHQPPVSPGKVGDATLAKVESDKKQQKSCSPLHYSLN